MNIIKVEFKSQFKGLMIWTSSVAAMFIMFIAFFPSMKNSQMQQLMGAKLDALPKAMLQAFNLNVLPNFADLLQYFAYCAQYLTMAGAIYASILGVSSLIKEESEGTIEFLYAKPVSRKTIVTSKLLGNLALLLCFNIIIFIVCAISCFFVAPKGYSFIPNLLLIIISGLIIEIIYFSIGFAFSTLISSLRGASSCALGIFFITYILGIFSGVVEKLEFLKYLSPYKYMLPSEVIRKGYSLQSIYILLTILIIALSIAFTYFKYDRKDMKL